MLNNVTIMGRLTADPELRKTGGGTSVTTFTLACDRDFKTDGEKQADFFEVVAWKHTAEFVSKYFAKGRMAVVSGRLQVRKWQNKDGENRYSTEVVAENVYFGDSKKEETGGNTNGSGYGSQFSGFAGVEADESDLPF